MKTTAKLFHQYNNALKKRLLPEPKNREPIECDSFSDKYDDVINYSLKEHGMEFNRDYEDQQREADEIINDFENW